LIFEDQPRGVGAHMLEKIKEVLVFHTSCPGQIRELYGYRKCSSERIPRSLSERSGDPAFGAAGLASELQ
ncbi:MAG: hypothetical protein KJP05_09595, partial [Deltaproteobacteria bacterium]|nr:hypothetical protein [Deltaproteobacteria bacterium]